MTPQDKERQDFEAWFASHHRFSAAAADWNLRESDWVVWQARAALAQPAAQADLDAARAICAQQAEDEALWFVTKTLPEEYLQAELRRLHRAIEGT